MDPSLGIRLDLEFGGPQYQQIFDAVVDRIQSGAFPPGFRLPPSRRFATALGTHRNTVVRAYQDLEQAGFVTGVVGRGTFVADATGRKEPGVIAEAPAGSIPWASLLSEAATAEPLSRVDRLLNTPPPPGAIDLARMEPSSDLMPAELLGRCVEHALRTKGAKVLGYAPREGLHRLRARIADDLVRRGVPAAAEDLVVTTGSQQALDLVARALITPGAPVLVDDTTYAGALNLLTLAGARLLPVPRDREGPDLDALERLAHAQPRAFYLMPGCHNPTAEIISDSRREALVAWSRRRGVPLIEDDYASDLVLSREPMPPPLRARCGDVIYLGTYSKKLMPALRVGYLLCPRRLRPALLPMKHALDLGTSLLLQHALAEFLDRGYLQPHLERVRLEYRRRRDALIDVLYHHLPESFEPALPRTGVWIWVSLPPGVSPDRVREAARAKGVLVSTSSFNAVDPAGPRGVRLLFCKEPIERVEEGGRRFAEALTEVMEEHRPRGRETVTFGPI